MVRRLSGGTNSLKKKKVVFVFVTDGKGGLFSGLEASQKPFPPSSASLTLKGENTINSFL